MNLYHIRKQDSHYIIYTNGQTTTSQAQNIDVWANQQRVKLIRFSKVRTDNDGNASRGCLIQNEQGDERWCSMPSTGFFREIQWGQWCYYYGHNIRPSLGLLPIESKTPDAKEFIMNQQEADRFSRIAEQNKQHIEPQPIDWTQPSQANDDLITEITGTLGKFVMLTTEFNPMLSEEAIIKLAISGYIQYCKQKEQQPLY